MSTQAQISIEDAEANFETVIARVEVGETIILTRDGHPIACIGPAKNPIVYGDLAHLGPLLADDLSLPEDIIDDFEKSLARTARQRRRPPAARRKPRSEA